MYDRQAVIEGGCIMLSGRDKDKTLDLECDCENLPHHQSLRRHNIKCVISSSRRRKFFLGF